MFQEDLKTLDSQVQEAIDSELKRQQNTLELIASENIVAKSVMQAQGSVMTNKYAEGYPDKRYYGGCEYVDVVEKLAIERVCKIFGSKFANVQSHSGSQANQAVFYALLQPGDTILGMGLDMGGHLTHGSKVNISGKFYDAVTYGLNKETEMLDYAEILKQAKECKPKLIIAGASAYSRSIDFAEFRKIADEVGAYLMVDMAHIAGLVAADLHQNPMEFADVVTSTTHKTLRGPRGGLILTNNEDLAKKLNSVVFPGMQGGPLMHVIAAKAVAFKQALEPEFKEYMIQVKDNAKIIADILVDNGSRLISKTTDNHLVLIDTVSSFGLTGKVAEHALEQAGLTCNKNSIPFDQQSPFVTSGIRIGTPAITSRGLGSAEAELVAKLMIDVLSNTDQEGNTNAEVLANAQAEVKKLCQQFPIYD
ncbi:MAG TPA: serine hydroxymethyltransferase [Alphaproteobacteria bacterium]|nr:serine hydroxymethyltransferase [Alphaproteobacteria bacterium]